MSGPDGNYQSLTIGIFKVFEVFMHKSLIAGMTKR